MTPINADQVAWLKDAIWRYGETLKIAIQYPRCSQLTKAAEIACLTEIMSVANLQFEDEAARQNAVSSILTKTAEECRNVA